MCGFDQRSVFHFGIDDLQGVIVALDPDTTLATGGFADAPRKHLPPDGAY